MKKRTELKFTKITAVLAFSFFLFSCASAPKAQEPAAEPETAVEEIPQPQEAEPEAEETPEEIQSPEEEATEEIAEEKVYEPVLELIEDIPGYYESDPKPVFLEPQELSDNSKDNNDETIEEKKSEEKTEDNKEVTKEEPQVAVIPSQEIPKVEVITAPSPVETEEKPETKESYTQEAETTPAESVEVEVEVAGISAVEEVESSELLSTTNESEETEDRPSENKIVVVPSRSVEMKNSQYLDIVYPGTGWIYLGEEDGKTTMRYFGRKIGERNTVFSLRSREEGNTILHFYKNDQLTGKFIDDYLQVEIKGTNKSPEHAVAPSYAEIVPPKPEKKTLIQPKIVETSEEEETKAQEISAPKTSAPVVAASPVQKPAPKTIKTPAPKTEAKKISTTTSSANEVEEDNGTKTVNQQKNSDSEQRTTPKSENSLLTESAPQEKTVSSVSKNSIQNTENMSSDEILEKAKESFKNKKYEDTLAYLDDFFAKATTKIDEGLMLQGQTFETNSSVRNIKSALDTYETIVRRYPQSIHWPKANERITYLRKFYFNIR